MHYQLQSTQQNLVVFVNEVCRYFATYDLAKNGVAAWCSGLRFIHFTGHIVRVVQQNLAAYRQILQ